MYEQEKKCIEKANTMNRNYLKDVISDAEIQSLNLEFISKNLQRNEAESFLEKITKISADIEDFRKNSLQCNEIVFKKQSKSSYLGQLNTSYFKISSDFGNVKRKFIGHDNDIGHIISMQLFDDSTKLITASLDRTYKIWDINSGAFIESYKTMLYESVTSIVITKRNMLISALEEGDILKRNVDDFYCYQTYLKKRAGVEC